MSDNINEDLLDLHMDKAIDTIGSDRDSIIQEDDIPEEDIDLLQNIWQSNLDLLTLSELVHIIDYLSYDKILII